MPAPRKLKADQEAAIIAWYAQYQAALSELRKLGTVTELAKGYGVSPRAIHLIANREEEKARRCLKGSRP